MLGVVFASTEKFRMAGRRKRRPSLPFEFDADGKIYILLLMSTKQHSEEELYHVAIFPRRKLCPQ